MALPLCPLCPLCPSTLLRAPERQSRGIGPAGAAPTRSPEAPELRLSQPTVTESVQEIDDEADREPGAKPPPRASRQPVHDEHTAGCREHGDRPDERHAKRPRPIGFRVAQDED